MRERLNRGSDEFDLPPSATTLATSETEFANTTRVLPYGNRKIIRAAVNDAMVNQGQPIAGVRRVALFPPMTGG